MMDVVRNIGMAVLVFLSSVTPVAASDQFDLNCDLEETNSLQPGQVNHFTRHLSIDLDAGNWCTRDEDCKKIHKIVGLTPDEIQLFDTDSSFMKLQLSINRHTWMWIDHAHIKEFLESGGETKGPCKLSPFTPLPIAPNSPE
jgi:hypothetical protein